MRVLLKVGIAGCASFFVSCSLFTSYPATTAPAREAFARGRFDEALSQLPQDPDGPDELLYFLEKGLISHTAGKFDASNEAFLAAARVIQGFEDRPTISVRSGLEQVTSLVLNDKALPYDGEGFEKVLLHSYLALNFYFLGKYDDAFVEVRIAYDIQKEQEERYSTSYHGQGAFSHYLSGLVRETINEPGEAYIDYRKVHELNPSSHTVQADLLRLSKSLGFEDDYQNWLQQFPPNTAQPNPEPNAGEIVCFLQCGLGPIKRPIEILIPHPGGFTKFVAPDFISRPNPAVSARLLMDDKKLGETELLEDVESVAEQNLKDRIALIVTKAAARAASKAALTHKLDQEHGDWGAVLGTLFALITEQADLRSWLTLPKSFEVLRVSLPEGTHHFSVELLDQAGNVISQVSLGTYQVRPKERVILNLRSVGTLLFSHFLGGKWVEAKEVKQ